MLLSLGLLAFRIWMLVHVIKNAPEDKKTMWILLVLFVPLADWVYFFTKKKEWTAAAPKKSTES
ncbi:PLDc N-terminal domain-containing protein [Candidatus Dojkabacteria bacterium]|nr:PLDc N-terminal domain-containing protein [Candidatus Dojkabacteria bacterium]